MKYRVYVTGSIETEIEADSQSDAERIINERLEDVYPQWDCCVTVEKAERGESNAAR